MRSMYAIVLFVALAGSALAQTQQPKPAIRRQKTALS